MNRSHALALSGVALFLASSASVLAAPLGPQCVPAVANPSIYRNCHLHVTKGQEFCRCGIAPQALRRGIAPNDRGEVTGSLGATPSGMSRANPGLSGTAGFFSAGRPAAVANPARATAGSMASGALNSGLGVQGVELGNTLAAQPDAGAFGGSGRSALSAGAAFGGRADVGPASTGSIGGNFAANGGISRGFGGRDAARGGGNGGGDAYGGLGNPGNDRSVGRAGESPNGADFGGGTRGQGDVSHGGGQLGGNVGGHVGGEVGAGAGLGGGVASLGGSGDASGGGSLGNGGRGEHGNSGNHGNNGNHGDHGNNGNHGGDHGDHGNHGNNGFGNGGHDGSPNGMQDSTR